LKRAERDDEAEIEYLSSFRSSEPFAIIWGVPLGKLPDGAEKLLLAWEPSEDASGRRFVLMADGMTTDYVREDEFEQLPRAKPAGGPSAPPERGKP
jgi:hypothetical protein